MPTGRSCLVSEGELALGVGAQPRQLRVAALAHLRLPLDELVRVVDRRRHQRPRLVGRVAEHQSLVARALVLGQRAVDALRDVDGLLADDVDDTAGAAVEADLGGVVADVDDDRSHQRLEVDPGGGRDLAGDDRDAGLDQRLAGDARPRVAREQGVQHGVRDLVGNLVGMAFGDGLGGEKVIA